MLGALLMGLSAWWLISSPSPERVEALYSRSLYPAITKVLVPLTNSVELSVAASLLALLPLLWLLALRLSWRRSEDRGLWFLRSLWRTTVGLVVVFLLFVGLWGANYRRSSIEAQFGLVDKVSIQADLMRLVDSLTRTVQATVDTPRDEARALASVARSLQALVTEVTGVVPTLPQEVKRLPPGLLIVSGSASGVVSPWTLEPHVDGALPDVSYVAVGAHELAHVAGYAGEADADFVAALAGLRADDAFARYAVALRLWQAAVAQLPSETREGYYDALPPSAQTDLERMADPFRRYRPPAWLQGWQRRSYDRYLKTQGVEAGIADYSRTVNLLIAAQQKGLLGPLEP